MFLYEKNIYKNLIFSFIVTTFSICIVLWTVQSIRYLEVILDQGAKVLDFLSLTLCLIPLLLFIIFPVSSFFTVYYVYRKLLHDKEIIILYSLGLTRIDMIKIFIKGTIFIVIIHMLISFYLLPISTRKFKNLKLDINQNSIINMLQFNTFIRKIKDLTIYIEKKEDNNILKNIFINDSRNYNKQITFISSVGKIYSNKKTHQLILYNGIKIEFQNNKKRYSMVKFSKLTMNLKQEKKIRNNIIYDSYELSVPELLFSNTIYKKNTKVKTQGHFRIIWPFTSLFIVIVMLYFLTQKEDPRMDNNKLNFCVYSSVSLIIGFNILAYIHNQVSYKYYFLIYLFNLLLPSILLSRLSILNRQSLSKLKKLYQ